MSWTDDDLLTEDMTEEVLLRVVVKSLLRFRCVNKRWCALIDSKYFVKNHSKNIQTKSKNTTHHRIVFLTYSYEGDSISQLYSLVQYSKTLVLPITITNHRYYIQILGSCNGLLCIRISFDDKKTLLFIWNPATRKHLKLPSEHIRHVLAYGFGYDSVSDDYKVVLMMHRPERLFYETFFRRSTTYVYTLGSYSWRNFDDVGCLTYPINHRQRNGVLACGVLHWIAGERDHHGDEYIIAFDLTTETDLIITLPELFHDDNDDEVLSLTASELGGCLSIVCKHPNKVGVFDVWVMKDYGVRESWLKLLTLSDSEINIPSICFVFPLMYSESGDEVLLKVASKRLLWFNLEKRIVKLVDVCGIMDSHPVIYFESLVSLGDKAENDYKNWKKRSHESYLTGFLLDGK